MESYPTTLKLSSPRSGNGFLGSRVGYITANREDVRYFSTSGNNNSNFYQVDPFFIPGFIDAEGSFILSLVKNKAYKTGVKVDLTFAIVLHKKDLVLLESIRLSLGNIGQISSLGKDAIQFRVRKIEELKILINFLDKYSLKSQKLGDFLLFKQAFEICSNKQHLTTEGLEKLVAIRLSMNKPILEGDYFTQLFPKVISVPRPLVISKQIDNPGWIAGFTSGDGSFYIQINGKIASLKFSLFQSSRDEVLLETIKQFLGCGLVFTYTNTTNSSLVVTKFSEVNEKIIPLFKKHPIHGVKALDFADFCEAAEIIKTKEHLTSEGLDNIIKIKGRMNKSRTLDPEKLLPFNNLPLQVPCNDQKAIGNGKVESYSNKLTPVIRVQKRGYHNTAKVKILRIRNNSQVTNAYNSLVATSEAIRLLNRNKRSIHKLSNSDRNLNFKQWLAGLIDGDGCFTLSKQGYAGLEITMDIRDEQALQAVKNVYGGSIKLRSNANALRYRLHHKEGLLILINDVNGYIRNSNRLVQLNKICIRYDLNLIWPEKLTYDNAWLSGFFDACGDIQLHPPVIGPSHSEEERLVNNNPQIVISVINKDYNLLIPYKEFFGGVISIISNDRYFWSIVTAEYFLKDQRFDLFKEYVKNYPIRASHHKKLHLVDKFHSLVKMKAHQSSNNSLLNKAWLIFNNKFNRYIHTKANNSQYLDNIKSKNIIIWGSIIGSSIGFGRLTNQILNMYAFTNIQKSVLVDILLSDAWLNLGKGSKNPRLGFKQSLDKSSYVWNVFMVLFPFC